MINNCIVLAGGLGTRLRSVIPDLPKCMAPINGKPFIDYLIDNLQTQGVNNFIFSLGYKSEAFEEYLAMNLSKKRYQIYTEREPLGTGGAIKLACRNYPYQDVFITNGDTFFKANLKLLSAFHLDNQSVCTLSLKLMHKFDRYGVVELDSVHNIQNFKEKQFYEHGLINAGLYALNVVDFMNEGLPEKFSFEKEYLEKRTLHKKIMGIVQDAYFIDIGIPEDYAKAQDELNKIE